MSMIVHLYIRFLTISKIFQHSMHTMHQEMRQISVKDDPNEDDARSIDASVAAVALQKLHAAVDACVTFVWYPPYTSIQ